MAHFILDLPTWFNSATHLGDLFHTVQSIDVTVLAQDFKQSDIPGDVGKTWNHFVRTGQVWAFLIGIVAGYMVKTFTSFG
ncbi:MAG: hypothetical protein MUC48_07005 [Leptolyngbya sp. Prado105]|jgi:hypothetical protein|nr:hypothetical protein [Leptolyngbya sp. Prado105]